MFNPIVALLSGGYLVINLTEALVSIDVNSGKSTYNTLLRKPLPLPIWKRRQKSAGQIARFGGFVAIDFIDMDENRNNRAVERKLKER